MKGGKLMSKIVQISSTTKTDEHGEILEKIERNVIQYEQEPNYIKLYLDNILYLSDIPAGLNGILMALLSLMNYNNEIILNSAIKKRIANDLNTTTATISNALTKFTKGKILDRVDTGIYKVNPYLFGRGKWEDIKRIRLEVIFEPQGKTLMASIEKKSKEE